MVTTDHVLAVDLGQAGEFTALAVIEAQRQFDVPTKCLVRHLVRFAPGTPYAKIADAVQGLRQMEALADAPLVIDVTAVGNGVVPLFRAEESELRVVSAVLTAGHHAEWDQKGSWLVPRKDLITLLQLLLQSRRLQIPASIPEAQILARELATYRPKVNLNTQPDSIDWRTGADDDLILAVGLACWHAEKFPPSIDCGVVSIPRRSIFSRPDIYVPGGWRW
jgi:hypothetical protein